MKYASLLLIATVCFISCGGAGGGSFNANKLKGNYKLDFTPMLAELEKQLGNSEEDDPWGEFGIAMAKTMLESMEMHMNFKGSGKGEVKVDGASLGLLKGFVEDLAIDENMNFEYKVEQDSVFLVKMGEDEEFNEMGVIRYFSSSYDSLVLVAKDEEGNMPFNLLKVKE